MRTKYLATLAALFALVFAVIGVGCHGSSHQSDQKAGAQLVITGPGGSTANTISVLNYGADLTGAGDSSTPIQNALNSGSAVYFPPGTYLVNTAPTLTVRQRVVIAPGVIFTGSGATNLSALGTMGTPVCAVAQPKIMMLGDSMLSGTNAGGATGMVGYARAMLYQNLRRHRADFDFTGNVMTLMEEAPTPLPFNVCNPGHLIATVATDLTTAVAAVGAPDILIVWTGGGDVANGRTLLQQETDWQTLESSIASSCPNATVIVTAPPGFVVGTTTGDAGTAATWSAQVASFNSWLQARYLNSTQYIYFGGVANLGFGELQYDGVHASQLAQAQWAQQMAVLVDQILGTRRGPTLPRDFRLRQPWQSVKIAANTDGLRIASASGLNPGSGSFAFAFDYYPTTVDTTTRVITEYGVHGTTPFWDLLMVSGHLNFYFNTGAGTIYPGSSPQTSSFMDLVPQLNHWHRIVIIFHQPSLSIGIYVNGQLAGMKQGVSAWSFTQQTQYFGLDSSSNNAAPGYYARVHGYQGAGIPQPGTMSAQLAVENDYYLGESLAEGYMSANYDLNGSLTPSSNGQPAATLVGTAAFVTAGYQGGTSPARPWDLQLQTLLPFGLLGLGGLAERLRGLSPSNDNADSDRRAA